MPIDSQVGFLDYFLIRNLKRMKDFATNSILVQLKPLKFRKSILIVSEEESKCIKKTTDERYCSYMPC